MRTQLIIFDLGGVLVRVEPLSLVRKLAQDTKQKAELLERTLVDPEVLEPFELGHITPQQYFHQLTRRLSLSWSFDEFVKAWNSILSENVGTTWLLERLRTRYTLLVLTNINVLHDEHIRRTWPIFGRVHHWVASYQVGLRKPEPQIYELVLRQANVPPEAVVYVDDVHEHIEAAQRLGIATVHFTNGLKLEQELQRVGIHV